MVATYSRDDLRAGRADWIASPSLGLRHRAYSVATRLFGNTNELSPRLQPRSKAS